MPFKPKGPLLVALLVLFGLPLVTKAQTPDRPRVGLVLSGGGAKGIAHIGVLRVLEEEGIPVDVISGSSMGAIVGGLYALGYSVDELEELVTNSDLTVLFSDEVRRTDLSLEERVASDRFALSIASKDLRLRIPAGIVEGQSAMTRLSRLTWGFHHVEDLTSLPIPFVAVATDLQSGQPTAISDRPLAEAIRASLSLPLIFTPAEFDGERYVDGGMSRNLPATEALDLGADILIGVDVGALPENRRLESASMASVLRHTMFYQGYRSDEEQRELIDVLISPDVEALAPLDFAIAEELMRLGREATRAALPELRALVPDRRSAPPQRGPGVNVERATISRIEVQGAEGKVLNLVLDRLDLHAPASLGPGDIEPAVARVYGTGLFRTVTYRVLPEDDPARGARLVVRVDENPSPDRVSAGVRYDTESGPEMLLSIALRNRLRFQSTTQIELRLGRFSRVGGSFSTPLGGGRRGILRLRTNLSAAPFRWRFPNGADTPSWSLPLEIRMARAQLFGGFKPTPSMAVGLYVKGEWISLRDDSEFPVGLEGTSGVNDFNPAREYGVGSVGFRLDLDTFDRTTYPHRGSRVAIDLRSGFSNAQPLFNRERTAGSARIEVVRLEAERYQPLSPRLSVFASTYGTIGRGEALPISAYGFLGGAFPPTVLPGSFIPLIGLGAVERVGTDAVAAAFGLQAEVQDGLFARLLFNAGKASSPMLRDDWRNLFPATPTPIESDFFLGVGIEAGLETPAGPIRVIIGSDATDISPTVAFSLGYRL